MTCSLWYPPVLRVTKFLRFALIHFFSALRAEFQFRCFLSIFFPRRASRARAPVPTLAGVSVSHALSKEGKVANKSMHCEFSNFKWTVLRAPWTDSNDQGRKMTAFERTFRKTKRKKFLSQFDFSIFEKTDFCWTVFENQKSKDRRFGWPYGEK